MATSSNDEECTDHCDYHSPDEMPKREFVTLGYYDNETDSCNKNTCRPPLRTTSGDNPRSMVTFDSTFEIESVDVNFLIMDESGTLKQASNNVQEYGIFEKIPFLDKNNKLDGSFQLRSMKYEHYYITGHYLTMTVDGKVEEDYCSYWKKENIADSFEKFKLKLKASKKYPGKFYFMVMKEKDEAHCRLSAAEHADDSHYKFQFFPAVP